MLAFDLCPKPFILVLQVNATSSTSSPSLCSYIQYLYAVYDEFNHSHYIMNMLPAGIFKMNEIIVE